MTGEASRFSAYLALIRPFTLLAPFFGGVTGGLTALAYTGNLSFDFWTLLPLVLGGLALVVLNSASNAFNQIYDVEIDRINKPYRPLPAGQLSNREALVFSLVLYILSGLLALLVSTVFLLFVVVIAVCTVLGKRLFPELA